MEYIQYIKPELLILIPVLNVIGFIIKKALKLDRYIPLILGVLSVVLSCLWIMGNGGNNLFHALFTGVIQGILCAGAAVYGNQVFKQYRKDE